MAADRLLLAAFVLAVVAQFDVTPAAAQGAGCRPWCVHYAGGRAGGTNCGFVSFQQCMMTAQGGDVCLPNSLCPRQGYIRGESTRRRR